MRRSLSHLPQRKKQELGRIADTIVEVVPATQMIILFGSHARGDWVEDRGWFTPLQSCFSQSNVCVSMM